MNRTLVAAFAMLALVPGAHVTVQDVDEVARRRADLMRRLPDGILLLHARSEAKAEDQPGFVQEAAFFYFTGLLEQPGAILALDGQRGEARLFVPPAPLSFGQRVFGLGPEPDPVSAAQLRLNAVSRWEGFATWIEARLAESAPILYVDEPRRPEATGNPPGLRPVAGPITLWRVALEDAFPEATIASAREVLRAMRWAKSEAEVEVLRANAQATVVALRPAVVAIVPGVTQRQVEGVVVDACLRAGAQGPSFWPWTMSGPNTQMSNLVHAFYSYEHLDRELLSGELVRVDIGCRGRGYGADVGRTIPVGGRFDAPQREIWELLVAGYQAGLDAMRADVPVDQVRAASRARIRALAPDLQTAQAREAAGALDTNAAWHLHGVGIESGEEALPVLRAGTVLAYEPMVAVGDNVLYLEDMILITESRHEVLSSGLPYTADEIEALATGHLND